MPEAAYNAKWLARVMAGTVIDAKGCWLWQGNLAQNGYGSTGYRGRTVILHRQMYKLLQNVALARYEYICHNCDEKRCINPDHLWVGTPKDNMQDKVRKGRHHEQTAERPPYKRDWKPKGLPPPAQRTHCPRGHPYSGDNLYVNPYDGRRECRTCRRAAVARVQQRQREQRA